MIFEINLIQVAAEHVEAFEAAFAKASPILRTAQGCRSAELLRCIERPGHYQVRVGWGSIADHVENWPSSDQARRVRALLAPLIQESELLHYEAVME